MSVSALLDTNLFIDVSRNYAPAVKWMQNNAQTIVGVPSFVRMELVLGAKDKVKQQKIIGLLGSLPIIHVTETDSRWAMEQFEIFHLSHRVGIIDCFIAAACVRLNVPIYSRNAKDFSILPGVEVIIPYT